MKSAKTAPDTTMVVDQTQQHTPRGVVLPIQYLRGLAALMVVWHHAQGQVPGVAEFISFTFGYEGVDLFFVISGFIMVVTTEGTATTPGQFMLRRIVRVVPLYWILTIVMVSLSAVLPHVFRTLDARPETFIKSLLFIPHYSDSFPVEVWPLLVPGWTLNYEMYFYLVFGLMLFLPERARIPAMVLYFVGSLMIGLVSGPFASAVAETYTSYLLVEFAAGVLIGHAWNAGRLRLPFSASLFCIVAGIVLVVGLGGRIGPLFGASLVVMGALHPRFMQWRQDQLLKLGNSSYSLYLTHLFALGALRIAWVRMIPAPPTFMTAAAFMLTALVVCVIVGYLSFVLVERPLLRLFQLPSRSRMGIS